jgi:hypothetical protein
MRKRDRLCLGVQGKWRRGGENERGKEAHDSSPQGETMPQREIVASRQSVVGALDSGRTELRLP